MKRVYNFLKKAEVYYLATVEGDQPRVRPFGTINEFEGKLYIQTGKVKPTSHQLAANPKAEICAFTEGAWIRIACELIEDDRFEAKKSMLDAYPNLRGMYDENDGNTQVFYMKNATAMFCAFGRRRKSWSFDLSCPDKPFLIIASIHTALPPIILLMRILKRRSSVIRAAASGMPSLCASPAEM